MSGAATGGILAARAGMKAAGKSALVGGVILAAIEGLNIVVMRVIMPAFEKKQAEEGQVVDTLLPPVDPSRPRTTYHANKGLFDPNSQPSSSPLLSGGGNYFGGSASSFGSADSSASTSQWDAPGFAVDQATKNNNSEPKSTGSSWKFW